MFFCLSRTFSNSSLIVEVEKKKENHQMKRVSQSCAVRTGAGGIWGRIAQMTIPSHPFTCMHLASFFLFPVKASVKQREGNMFGSACVGGGVGVV